MIFSTAAVLAASAAVALGELHTITVGANGTKAFSPANITAAIGDSVQFVFMGGNHTATISTFATPCNALVNTSVADTSLQRVSSGYMPVPANATDYPVWVMQITQPAPIWLYCEQVPHCSKAGMVASINAVETGNKTYEAFKALAMQANQTLPGTAGGNSTAPAPSASGSGSASPSSTASQAGDQSSPSASGSAAGAKATGNGAVSLKGKTGLATVGVSFAGALVALML